VGAGKVTWFRKKKPKVSISDIPIRIRGFILDSQVDDPHELSVILGCSVISDEVQQKEETESDKRVEKIGYLIPLLYSHSHLLSEGTVELQRANASSEEVKALPDEIWWETRKMMEHIAITALMGSVSQLVDMGLLEIPKEHRK
jgi:hypothetical protein